MRNASTRGLLKTCLPWKTSRQCPRAASSVILLIASSAPRTFCSKRSRISSMLFSFSGDGPPGANSSVVAILSAIPVTPARCAANSPSVRDLICGFHVSLSPGTRSSRRRVGGISARNSFRIPSTAGVIASPPSRSHDFELLYQGDASGGSRAQVAQIESSGEFEELGRNGTDSHPK